MKFLFVIISVLFLATNIFSQPAKPLKTVKAENKKEEKNLKSYLDSAKYSEKRTPVKIPKIDADSSLAIDGNLDEAVWASAVVFKDFIQTDPGDNVPPSKPTQTLMFYDEKNLYIAFKCWDEKDKIRSTVAKRDEIFADDNVRVYLDTYDDQRRAYLLGWNPLGIQADGILIEGQNADFSVDIVMESKGKIHEWGWTVEVKIPFKSLRYKAGKGKFWGFNATRSIVRNNNEFNSWMPQDRNIQGFLIQSGKITGLEGISKERTLEIIPSVTISETGRRVSDNQIPEGRFVNEPVKTDLSLNLKYNITPNITLDAAINPDFAEVEADAPVVTANQRFPIFFPERRPFFLEGTEIFQSPLQVFNSRTIVDPDVATKLTGKVGKNSFGFLVASDNAPGNFSENEINNSNIRPFIDEFIDKNATFAILRLKRDFGKENDIGFFGTARTFPENKNFVGGIDGNIKVNPSTTFNFQAVATTSKKCFFEPFFDDLNNPNQATRNAEICNGNRFQQYRTGNGFGYIATYSDQKETFGYWIQAFGRSEDYRADSGFTRRTDNHLIGGVIRKTSKSRPNAKLIRTSFSTFIGTAFSGKGRRQASEWNATTTFNLQKNTAINVWGGIAPQTIYEDEFGLARNENRSGRFFGDDSRSIFIRWVGGSFITNPNKLLAFNFSITQAWDVWDFDFGAGRRFPRVSPAALQGDFRLDPGGGDRLTSTVGIDLTPTDPLRISFTYNKAKLVRRDTKRTAFDSNIFSLKTTYNFSRFIFTRVRMDYDTLETSFRGQYLFGWTPSPGKAFYIGYNDDLSYNGFNPYTGIRENGFQRNERTFFIRMSYLFRKSF